MDDVLLERDHETDALDRALRDLLAGSGGLVTVAAEAGLGKTTLLRYLRREAGSAGALVLSARASELEREFTFGVVRQLFDPIPGAEARLVTGQANDSLHDLLTGLYRLLVTAADGRPAVVLVDDAQWADELSLRFLIFLANRSATVPVTVVIAHRTGEDVPSALDRLPSDAVVVRPRGLSRDAVGSIVRSVAGAAVSEELCAACHAITDGNPAYVRELLRDGLPDARAIASGGPNAVRRYIETRLRRQPATHRVVARAVAVLGADAALSLVARHVGLPSAEVAEAAESLARAGILEREDPPAFSHDVVREVVLSTIPLAERSAAHERAAAILTDVGAPPTRVGLHLLHTTPANDADRIGVLLAAAAHARQQGSPATAAVYLRRALAEPPPPAQRSEVNRLLGGCLTHELVLEEAEAHLRIALSLADSAAQRALCAYSLARLVHARGALGEAVSLLTDAAANLPAEHAGLAPELTAELVGIARNHIASRPVVREHLPALRAGSANAVHDAQLSVETLVAGGPVEEAVALARRALLGERLPVDRTNLWTAVYTLVAADRLAEAERRLHRALHTALRQGISFSVALAHGFLAYCALSRGDLVRAGEHVRAGTHAVPATTLASPVLQAVQVRVLVAQGRLAEAATVLRDSVLGDEQEPQTGLALWLLDARIRLRVAQERPAAVLSDAQACELLYQHWEATEFLDVPWRLHAAWAWARLGEHDRASTAVGEHLRLARKADDDRHIGLALLASAKITGSRTDLRAAMTRLRRTNARLELADTMSCLGSALQTDGNDAEARGVLAQAADLASQCHATRLTNELRGDVASRTAGAFTPAERQVAELATTGLTNRQIAQQLFVSQKTVESHLSRAYRKAGVRTRTQLAVHLHNN